MKHEEVVQMRFISKLVQKYKRATPKQLVLVGVFMLAFAGAIGAGFASQQSSFAGSSYNPDCKDNSIMRCGAVDRQTFINKLNNGDAYNGKPSHTDLKKIYADSKIGLDPSEYGQFASEAVQGYIHRNGDITVNGVVVATGAMTVGRTGSSSAAIKLGGKTYYHGTPSQRWSNPETQMMPVMVWFNELGVVQTVIMNDCGNPVIKYTPKRPVAECKVLNTHKIGKNEYQFSTSVVDPVRAKYVSFKYYVNGVLKATTTSASKKSDPIKITKDSKVEVKIDIKYTNGKTKTAAKKCETQVPFEEEEKFVYACDKLYATSKDNITFRFNVKASHSSNVKLISADFTLDGSVTTKDVMDKNEKGEIYKEYTFDDEKVHTVTAVVNFKYTKDGVEHKAKTEVSSDCTKQVKPKQPPVCEYNPNLPPDHPDCKPPVEKCIPEGKEDENCELPNTGPAGVAGLFAGVTAAGAIGHRLFMNYRSRR